MKEINNTTMKTEELRRELRFGNFIRFNEIDFEDNIIEPNEKDKADDFIETFKLKYSIKLKELEKGDQDELAKAWQLGAEAGCDYGQGIITVRPKNPYLKN